MAIWWKLEKEEKKKGVIALRLSHEAADSEV